MNKKIKHNEVIAANIEVHNELVKKGEDKIRKDNI